MFILKFDGYYPATSNNNQIIVNKPYNYKITVDYNEKDSKRFIKMENISTVNKKNDCYIDMDNLQAFIVKDFLIFIQIDNLKPGIIKFENYGGSSGTSTLIPQEYKLDILNNPDVLYYGKLLFILSGVNVVNKIEVLEMSSLTKSVEKIDLNDFESIINAIDFRANLMHNNNQNEQIANLTVQLKKAIEIIDSGNAKIAELNQINTKLQNDLAKCENKPIIEIISVKPPVVQEFLTQKKYIFTQIMQKYSFGESIFHFEGYSGMNSYSVDKTNIDAISTWWFDFEKKFNIKKENLIIEEKNNGQRWSKILPIAQTMYVYDYNLYNLNILKIKEKKYTIEIIEFVVGEKAYTTDNITMNSIGVEKDLVNSNSSSYFNSNKYSIVIDNVTIKTDKVFQFNNVGAINSSEKGVNRFIEFEWDAAKGKPIIDKKDVNTQRGIDFIGEKFPKLLDVLREFIIN